MNGKVKLIKKWRRTTMIDIVNHLVYMNGPVDANEILAEIYEPDPSGGWDAIHARERIEETINRLVNRRQIEATLVDMKLRYTTSKANPRANGVEAMRRQRQRVNSRKVG